MIEDPWGQYDQKPLHRLAKITHLEIAKLSNDFKIDLLKICEGPSMNKIFGFVSNISSSQEYAILQRKDPPIFLSVEDCILLINDAITVWLEQKGYSKIKIERELKQFYQATNLNLGIRESYNEGVEYGKELDALFYKTK